MTFAQRFVANFKRGKRTKIQKVDIVAQHVKKVLEDADQRLILMVRG